MNTNGNLALKEFQDESAEDSRRYTMESEIVWNEAYGDFEVNVRVYADNEIGWRWVTDGKTAKTRSQAESIAESMIALYMIDYSPAPAFDLVIVEKPAPITVGTIIHFKAYGITTDLPILMVINDKYGRFDTYIVENPMWAEGGQAMPYMPIFSTSTWVQGYGVTVELNAKQWTLLAAMQAREAATRWKKFARRYQSRIVSTSTTQAIRTSKGFGFHDAIETELLEGDKARYEKRMKHAAHWQSVYDGLIALVEVA